jgi:hypothetical protein
MGTSSFFLDFGIFSSPHGGTGNKGNSSSAKFFPFSSFLWMTGSHINRWGTTNFNHPTTKQGHPTKRKFEYRSWGLKTPKLQATDMSRLCE